MGGSGKDRLYKVFLLGGHSTDAFPTAALGFILRKSKTFDITAVSQGKDGEFLLNQVFIFQIFHNILNLGSALITELVTNGDQFLFQNSLDLLRIGKKIFIILDFSLQLFVFIFQFFPIQALKLNQTHIADILGLNIIQLKTLHQALFRIIIAASDNMDDLIYIVLCNEQAFQQMGAFFCFP